ncbi:hypothetical protein [Pseudalkalibacillus salsuginis]|uniref:hypothetical protein n=1 Tax=Pseudalkalibacillus salsuginis TaxID=2910972 RepID=UPI001CD31F31|nr:hypothetical protein [Pseudalkalibacillus salsuginis]MCF6408982.1 hypothetical protein [Pseudalkalibacillus salsuginis]
MPRNTQDHRKPTSHPDGEKESIINDSTATQGGQMGIYVDQQNDLDNRDPNPFHLSQSQPDEDMKDFEKLMRGKKADSSK